MRALHAAEEALIALPLQRKVRRPSTLWIRSPGGFVPRSPYQSVGGLEKGRCEAFDAQARSLICPCQTNNPGNEHNCRSPIYSNHGKTP